jgi:hypothetical protein
MAKYQENRSEKKALQLVDSIFSSEKIPEKYKEPTISKIKEALKKKLTRGHTIEGMVRNITYLLIKEDSSVSCPILLKETKKPTRELRRLQQELDIKPRHDIVLPRSFIEALNLGETEVADIKSILSNEDVKKMFLGKGPAGVLGGLLYLYLRHVDPRGMSQRELSMLTKVTEATIRNRIEEIRHSTGIIEAIKKCDPSRHEYKIPMLPIKMILEERNKKHECKQKHTRCEFCKCRIKITAYHSHLVDHHELKAVNEDARVMPKTPRSGKCDKCGRLTRLYPLRGDFSGGFGYFCQECYLGRENSISFTRGTQHKVKNRHYSHDLKKKLFDYLDTFLAPDHLEYPLPKPRHVSTVCNISINTVYRGYYDWRKLHPDDFRVKAHHKKYTGE